MTGTHAHPTDRLRETLLYSNASGARDLFHRMSRCGSEDWNWHFTCRTPACSACRSRYIGQQCRSAKRRFGACANEDLAFLTIVIGAAESVDEIADLFAKFKKDVRNVIDTKRRIKGQWHGVELLLWLETDAFAVEDFTLLGPDKQAQLCVMAPLFVGDGKPVWVATVHGIVHLNGLEHQQLRYELECRWRAPKQVDVRPFFDHRTVAQNITSTINYALKHDCRIHLGRITDTWPVLWREEYYCFLQRWSRGFQSLRLSIGPRKENINSITVFDCNTDSEQYDPMPFTYSNSIFDSYYN
jgi:hypothetical protein